MEILPRLCLRMCVIYIYIYVLLALSACRKEALWLLNRVLKVVEQSPMYDWLQLLSCLVTVAWYITSLYKHLPFYGQWESCLQLHCVLFGLVVVVGVYAVLTLTRSMDHICP